MARFTPQKFDYNDINGGERFKNGQVPQEDAFNAPIEGSAYAIEKAEDAIAKADQALNFAFGSVGTFSPLTAYPLGSVYISTNATSPASLFGGSWERIEDVFLLSAGAKYLAGRTGGSANAVVVSHRHDDIITSVYDNTVVMSGGSTYGGTYSAPYVNAPSGNNNYSGQLQTTFTGVDGTDKNMPPYLTVYMWQRIE